MSDKEAITTTEQAPLAHPAVLAIQTTVAKVETVRKYIQKNLNAGQRKLLKKIGKRQPTEPERAQLKALEIDYGTIPKVNKPFLLQPGAEKIALWLHVRPTYITEVTPIPDHPGHIEVHGRCKLMAVGPLPEVEMFSGPLASCTTMESNYRFRWVKMDPPPSYDWATKEGRIGKELGTHRSFKNNDGTWVWQERKENPNIYDEHNKVRQMGEKRMLVKAIRNFGALSEIFTEDPSEWTFDEPGAVTVEEPPAVPGSVVKEEPAAEPAPAQGVVEIRWPSDTAEVAIVTLPDLQGGADLAAKIMDFADWRPELRAWHCPAVYVPDVVELAKQLNLRVVEIDQKPKAAPPPAKPIEEPPSRSEVTGRVTLVSKQPGQKKGSAGYYVLTFAGKTVYSYHQSMFEHLAKAREQECVFIIESGNYPKIVGIKRIGPVEFHENVPVVQRREQ